MIPRYFVVAEATHAIQNPILSGVFDMNAKLARIDRNLEAITKWLENGGDDEEEEEDPSGPSS